MRNHRQGPGLGLKIVLSMGAAALLLPCASRVGLGQSARSPRDWIVIFRDCLRHDTLKFWLDHAVDHQYGGVLGRLDRQGNPVPPGDKSLVIESRTLWTFSQAYRRFPDPAYKELATNCLKFIRDKMWDRENGGYYFMVSREGRPLDTTKMLNPMSYTMEGLAEYALAFQDDSARREALELFRVIDRHAHDSRYGGYQTVYTKDWRWISNYPEGPNGPMLERKSYDWHLGLLESLATLGDITGDPQVRSRVSEILDILVDKIIDVNAGYGRFYFTDDWRVADRNGDSKLCEYGLDMEASWLMTESAGLVGRSQEAKIRRAAVALVDHGLKYGFDTEHGGLYGSGPPGGPATNTRMGWWQQAECLNATLNAYQMTGDPKYWNAFQREAQFVMDRFVDHEYGGWYSDILADGSINTEKGGPWTEPYHQTRASLEIIGRLGRTL